MKVGILTPSYPPDLNGVSISIYRLQKELEKMGVEVYIATSGKEGEVYPDNVLPLRSFPLPKFINSEVHVPIMSRRSAEKFFKEKKVDVIHTHDIFAGGWEGVSIAKNLGVPAVNTFHTYIEYYVDNYARFFTGGYLTLPGYRTLLRTFIRQVANGYDHIFSVSSKTDNYLKTVVKTKTETSVVSNLPDDDGLGVFKPNKKFKDEYGIGEEDFVFVTFGRVGPEKGLDSGLEVLEPVLKKYKNAKYLVIGWGPYINKLKALAKEKGLENQVIVGGRYEHTDLGKIVANCDVYLNTSITETQGLVLYEAMACGLPAVCIDDPAFVYLLRHDYNGFTGSKEELTEYCEMLYSDPKLLERLAKTAKKSADKLKKQNFAKHYYKVYKDLIEKNKKHILESENNKKSDFFSSLKDWIKIEF